MTQYNFSPLKGVISVQHATVNNQVQDNLIEYFDYALLDKGNYFNVSLGETDYNGEDFSRLRPARSEIYPSGQVWEGFRKNWVWQSGLAPSGKEPPIVGTNPNFPGISGVYIDGQFEPTSGVGPYKHHIDYLNGSVVFDSPVPTGTVVQAEYSHKYINVVYANNLPWLRQVQTETRYPTPNYLEINQGKWDLPPEARLQLPAIAIEMVPQRAYKGYQLGGGQVVYQDVVYHCLAEDEYTRNQLVDIISYQNDKTIFMFNLNTVYDSGAYPIDYRGMPVPSALLYPELLDQYSNGGRMRTTKTNVSEMIALNGDVFGGVVRTTVELIKTNI